VRIFSIPLFDYPGDAIKVPDLPPICKSGLVPTSLLREVILDCSFDYLYFHFIPSFFLVTGTSDELIYKNSFLCRVKELKEGKAKSMFSVCYLENLFGRDKISSAFEYVEIKLGENYPSIWTFEEDDVKFMFLLAPRIEEQGQ